MTDPLSLLARDRTEARSLNDPNANLCTLANVDARGWPQARTLVLRDLDGQLAVFVNATSPKFPYLDRVSIVTWLPTLEVQYRLACTTEPVPPDVVAASWRQRPEIPRRLDWLYTLKQAQSTPIGSREDLKALLASVPLPEPLEAPATACGLYLRPEHVERLHIGQPDGVHDRRSWHLEPGGWRESVLVP